MKEVQDRIQMIIDIYFDGNLNRACREFDIPQSSLINVVKGKRNKPSFDNICKLTSNQKYRVSLHWLIFEIGEMSDNKSITISEKEPDFYRTKYYEAKDKYYEAKDEIDKLRQELTEIHRTQDEAKDFYPDAMGDVRRAKAG